MIAKKGLSYFLCLLVTFFAIPLKADTSPISPSSLTIGAEGALLMDANTKTVLYEKNGYTTYYPASITKLMTALLAIEHLSPEEIITFSSTAVNSIEPNSNHLWMTEGEQITVDQALHGLLLESANEVANGLGEAVSGSIAGFAQLMTERAKELGALNTHFINPNGLHDNNHYTTAYDMALIASYLTSESYFLEIMKDTTYQIPPTNKNSEIRYLAQQHPMINPVKNPALFREDVIGGKTGYTDQARQTLVTMAQQGDTTLVAVILKAEKNTVYEDTKKLLDYGFNSYTSKTLHTTDEIIKTVPIYSVKSGQSYLAAHGGLSLVNDAKVILNQEVDESKIVLSFNLPDTLKPTVQIGDVVGSVDFILNSKILTSINLAVTKIDSQPIPKFNPGMHLSLLFVLKLLVSIALLVTVLFLISKYNRKRKYRKIKKMFKQ